MKHDRLLELRSKQFQLLLTTIEDRGPSQETWLNYPPGNTLSAHAPRGIFRAVLCYQRGVWQREGGGEDRRLCVNE